ncbi:MAG TPA: hypothetical protein VEK76_07380 [Candidatus Binatia bacterium]|nr:hypothetical protein [Candidatus Binatia bacterium]
MTTRACALREERRPLTFSVAYGQQDVEATAETLGVPVCDAEAEAILARLDGELTTLAAAATRRAVAGRIADELRRLSRTHAADVDD